MTLLTLEALDADEGDCLLLHHGTAAKPAHILIDGGIAKVYANTLAPHLEALRKRRHLGSTDPLPIELAVLTHVDADHIAGFVALTKKLLDARTSNTPLPWRIRQLWMNDFDDVLKNHEAARIQSVAASGPIEVQATAASVQQARSLRDNATQLGIPINADFKKIRFAARADDGVTRLERGELKLAILAPREATMKVFEEQWDRALKAILEGKTGKDVPNPDSLVTNAASIVLLVESGERRLLLTGDACSEDILAGLDAAGLLGGKQPYRVDVCKVQHHGAVGNCSEDFFRKVHARHYVISANGKSGNPDPETLERLWAARGASCADWTLHVTFAADELAHFRAWRKAHPDARVEHRAEKARGIAIHLGDEHL